MALDAIRRLNAIELNYMITGSTASNVWGIPRTTHDVDIVVQLAPADVPKVLAAFSKGFFIQEISVRGIFQPPHQFNAIDGDSGFKIDVWLLRTAAFERGAFQRRKRESIFGEIAWVSTAEDVLLHKLYWNKLSPSDRQLGDAAGVVAVQAGNLDLEYLRRWAKELG
jgi:hypothetical protein